jgi:glutamate-5-semialdehyde dehydrogenase
MMSIDAVEEVEHKGKLAVEAARSLGQAGTLQKNKALAAIASALKANEAAILEANSRDIAAAQAKGIAGAMVERLTLSPKRIDAMCEGLGDVQRLTDPIGVVVGGGTRPNGLQITKLRVPLGVIGIIYESRPNVSVDAGALCLKSGNAVILRGGSEAINSNIALVNTMRAAIETVGVSPDAVQLVENTDRAAARRLMTLNGFVDCLIPRGGASLIRTVIENATVPVIETGTGNCHVYVDRAADLNSALSIVLNAKTQRPSVCNAAESLLIHRDVASKFLPIIAEALISAGVEIRGDEAVCRAIPQATIAAESDWYEEYNALVLAVKVVETLQQAIDHIGKYGTKHSEAIVTEDYRSAQEFTDQVDAAAVYVNASTRFTDGFQFGMGAEIGISNQKLHARGPMGLEELTTYKYVIRGSGQTL